MPPRKGKRSPDPVQEALREHKATWNDAVSEFISSMIAGKQGINGKGNASFGLPPSNIKDPLPTEVGSFLQNLSSQFQQIVSGAGAIVNEQEQYSEHRRKKAPRPAGGIASPPSSPSGNIQNTLNNLASSRLRMIEKHGSTPVSRFWQYVSSPFRSDVSTKKRVALLAHGADLFYAFLDFDNTILSIDMELTPEVISKFQMLQHSLKGFATALSEGNLPAATVPESTPSNQPASISEKVDPPTNQIFPVIEEEEERVGPPTKPPPQISAPNQLPSQENITAYLNKATEFAMEAARSSIPLKSGAAEIRKGIGAFRKEKDPAKKTQIFEQIRRYVNELSVIVAADIDQETNESRRDKLKKMIMETSASFSQEAIIKLAHNFVSRYLKKQLLGLRKSNKTAYPRLRASDAIANIKKILQRMMNGLEKSFDPETVSNDLEAISEQMEAIKSSINVISSLYRQNFYYDYNSGKLDRPEGRRHPDMITPVMMEKMKKEFREAL